MSLTIASGPGMGVRPICMSCPIPDEAFSANENLEMWRDTDDDTYYQGQSPLSLMQFLMRHWECS